MQTSVLILEDDDSLREMLVELLQDYEYAALGACDCEEALIFADQCDFQLAISDIRMAGRLDGLGTMELIKQKNPAMGCIIITGYASDTSPSRAARIQADDYLYKPIELLPLLQMVQRVVNKSADRALYAGLLKSMFSLPQQMLQGRKREDLVEQLDQQRDRVLKAYYLKVRARDPWLTKTAARDLWDEIEELDVQFHLCFHHLREFSPAILQEMLKQYQEIQEHLYQVSQSQSLGNLRARQGAQVERANFFRFYDRLQTGEITAEQFRVAAAVRRIHPSRRNAELEKLFQHLWA